MAQSSLDRTLIAIINKQDYRALFSAMQLIALFLINPAFKNAIAIKRLLGFRISPHELLLEMKDPKSQTYKYCAELVLTFVNLLENRHIIYLQEQIQKEMERRLLEDLDDEFNAKLHQLWIDTIRSLQLKEELLNELLEQHKPTHFQWLLLQKLHELAFYLALTTNENSRTILWHFFTKLYSIREKNLERVGRLERRLQDPNISAEERSRIFAALEKYYLFERVFNEEKRMRILIKDLDNPSALQDRVEDILTVEKETKRELKKVDIDYVEALHTTIAKVAERLNISDQTKMENDNLINYLLKISSDSTMVDFNSDIQGQILKVISKIIDFNTNGNIPSIKILNENLKLLSSMMSGKEIFNETIEKLKNWSKNNLNIHMDQANDDHSSKINDTIQSNNDDNLQKHEIKITEGQDIFIEPNDDIHTISDSDREIIDHINVELNKRIDEVNTNQNLLTQLDIFKSALKDMYNWKPNQSEEFKARCDNIVQLYNKIVENYSSQIDLTVCEEFIKNLSFINPLELANLTIKDDLDHGY